MEHQVYLLLGTNLGDKQKNLNAAIAALPPVVQPIQRSPVYKTPSRQRASLHGPSGLCFLNQVLLAETTLLPKELLAYLRDLEIRLGRQETFRYGPRVIDVDILLYDDLILENGSLVIPHPKFHSRAFVLVPLHDLAPDLEHPVLGKTIQELLAQVDPTGIERCVENRSPANPF